MAKGTSSPNSSQSTPAEIDTSLNAWVHNMRQVLHSPITILTILALIVTGTFIEIAPRKSLDILDNYIASSLFFILPLLFAFTLDWSVGLLAAVVALIVFARIKRSATDEGFIDIMEGNNSVQSTKLVSSSHRWFVEKILGETPVAISSDKVRTSAIQNENTSSSSSSGHNASLLSLPTNTSMGSSSSSSK